LRTMTPPSRRRTSTIAAGDAFASNDISNILVPLILQSALERDGTSFKHSPSPSATPFRRSDVGRCAPCLSKFRAHRSASRRECRLWSPPSGERPLNGNPLSNSCLSPHPLGGTGGGIHSTSHTSERSTLGHCARTRLRVLARSSSGVRASFFFIIDSLSRSSMHPGDRTRCSCSAAASSRSLCLGFASHDPAMIVFRRATSAGRSASAKY
jgi:hypothetical protein